MNRHVEQDSFVNQTLMGVGEGETLPEQIKPSDRKRKIDFGYWIRAVICLSLVVGIAYIPTDVILSYNHLSALEMQRLLPSANAILLNCDASGDCNYKVQESREPFGVFDVELQCDKDYNRCAIVNQSRRF